jgi:hypothetical protein
VANGAVTIAKQAGDILAPSGSNPSTFTLNNGDTLVLESRGSANIWYAVGGSTRLAYAGNFGASLAATGYQKLPSGLIVQWGFFAGSNAGDTAITFPIAFPTNFLCATVSGLCSGTGAWGGYNSATKTGMNGNWWAAASTRQSGTATYIAFGY